MKPLKVFYDGACVLCYNEINHYKQKDELDLLELIDISAEDFRADYYGLDTEKINLHMHVIDSDGKIFTGIDSFIEIWKRIPPYNRLVPFFKNCLLRTGLDVGYGVFARYIRPRLPKRDCKKGVCTA
jgi:predicted DCC family thiol-disulfide oxidoreductase YuxK